MINMFIYSITKMSKRVQLLLVLGAQRFFDHQRFFDVVESMRMPENNIGFRYLNGAGRQADPASSSSFGFGQHGETRNPVFNIWGSSEGTCAAGLQAAGQVLHGQSMENAAFHHRHGLRQNGKRLVVAAAAQAVGQIAGAGITTWGQYYTVMKTMEDAEKQRGHSLAMMKEEHTLRSALVDKQGEQAEKQQRLEHELRKDLFEHEEKMNRIREDEPQRRRKAMDEYYNSEFAKLKEMVKEESESFSKHLSQVQVELSKDDVIESASQLARLYDRDHKKVIDDTRLHQRLHELIGRQAGGPVLLVFGEVQGSLDAIKSSMDCVQSLRERISVAYPEEHTAAKMEAKSDPPVVERFYPKLLTDHIEQKEFCAELGDTNMQHKVFTELDNKIRKLKKLKRETEIMAAVDKKHEESMLLVTNSWDDVFNAVQEEVTALLKHENLVKVILPKVNHDVARFNAAVDKELRDLKRIGNCVMALNERADALHKDCKDSCDEDRAKTQETIDLTQNEVGRQWLKKLCIDGHKEKKSTGEDSGAADDDGIVVERIFEEHVKRTVKEAINRNTEAVLLNDRVPTLVSEFFAGTDPTYRETVMSIFGDEWIKATNPGFVTKKLSDNNFDFDKTSKQIKQGMLDVQDLFICVDTTFNKVATETHPDILKEAERLGFWQGAVNKFQLIKSQCSLANLDADAVLTQHYSPLFDSIKQILQDAEKRELEEQMRLNYPPPPWLNAYLHQTGAGVSCTQKNEVTIYINVAMVGLRGMGKSTLNNVLRRVVKPSKKNVDGGASPRLNKQHKEQDGQVYFDSNVWAKSDVNQCTKAATGYVIPLEALNLSKYTNLQHEKQNVEVILWDIPGIDSDHTIKTYFQDYGLRHLDLVLLLTGSSWQTADDDMAKHLMIDQQPPVPTIVARTHVDSDTKPDALNEKGKEQIVREHREFMEKKLKLLFERNNRKMDGPVEDKYVLLGSHNSYLNYAGLESRSTTTSTTSSLQPRTTTTSRSHHQQHINDMNSNEKNLINSESRSDSNKTSNPIKIIDADDMIKNPDYDDAPVEPCRENHSTTRSSCSPLSSPLTSSPRLAGFLGRRQDEEIKIDGSDNNLHQLPRSSFTGKEHHRGLSTVPEEDCQDDHHEVEEFLDEFDMPRLKKKIVDIVEQKIEEKKNSDAANENLFEFAVAQKRHY